HLRIYAMDNQAVSERLDVAVDKCAKLGIKLSWNKSIQKITDKNQYNFDVLNLQGSFPFDKGLRTYNTAGDRSEECTVLGLGAFKHDPAVNGRTEGRDLTEGSGDLSPCAYMGRDDGCCALIPSLDKKNPKASSCIHRDKWPHYIWRYVLAHEIGHYFGLCHYGHDGFQNIMFTLDKDADLNFFDPGELKFYYNSEPEFTLSDGRNVWRFIVKQLRCCLDSSLQCATQVGNIGTVTQAVRDKAVVHIEKLARN